jgi:hypothetical protein
MTPETMTNIKSLLTTNPGVPNFPFTASKDVHVPAIGIANVAFEDASSSSSSPNPMEINKDYSVYVMVVDNNGNQSELFYGQRGRIDPQAPPIIEVTQVTTNDQQRNSVSTSIPSFDPPWSSRRNTCCHRQTSPTPCR